MSTDRIFRLGGANAGIDRAAEVARTLWRIVTGHGGSLALLGWTQQGQRAHPLQVPATALPECSTPHVEHEPTRWDGHALADGGWALLIGSSP